MSNPSTFLILITGATGYVGEHLLKALEERKARLRCLARHPEFLKSHVASLTQVVAGDLFHPQTLKPALDGVHTAYYLVHSLGSVGSFEEKDRRAAENFSRAARSAAVKRIIYLGGLGKRGASLSEHLRSRQEVGQILKESGIPVLEFRASVIIGRGSVSFEMVRALVDRLPVMTTPRWVRTPAQPIAIEDVIRYLVAALDRPIGESRIFEIGGADVVSYGDLMKEYARQRGLRRLFIPLPFLTPHLSSLWLGLVTPLYSRVGRKLIEGVKSPTVVTETSALQIFPFRPMGIREAIARACAPP